MNKPTNPPAGSALEIGEQFCRFADRIHGTFLDATLAMGGMAAWYMQTNQARWKRFENSDRQMTWDDFNPEVIYTGNVQGEEGDLHRSRVNDVIARNTPDGGNWEFLALMCVVGLYQVWDEHFRGTIAAALGVKAHDLKADIFGEIRHLRNAIIHRQGYASAEVSGAKLIRPFPEGTPMRLTPEDIHGIVGKMKDGARMLSRPAA